VVAIGEIGLDYYRDHSPKSTQHRFFQLQLQLARETGLPVCIHARDACADVLRYIEEARKAPGTLTGMLHCFAGTLDEARRVIDFGMQISIGGPVTYPNAGSLAAVVAAIPLERLLTETDCPYLPPQSIRGKRNEPVGVTEVAARIAELTGIALDSVREATANNARSLFRIGTPWESLK
jgi:TatD DNase family protein